ncbi:MAG: hypothetical protein IPH45_04005 [Bacteroidales bacterium]|nr:hypothetical protein [Bacteroidales bacterium]
MNPWLHALMPRQIYEKRLIRHQLFSVRTGICNNYAKSLWQAFPICTYEQSMTRKSLEAVINYRLTNFPAGIEIPFPSTR